jgi:hypothetical protein
MRLRTTQRWSVFTVACIVKLSVLAFFVVAHGAPDVAAAAAAVTPGRDAAALPANPRSGDAGAAAAHGAAAR